MMVCLKCAGDALEDDFDLGSGSGSDGSAGDDSDAEDEPEGGMEAAASQKSKPLTKLEARRAARAAGNHPLAAGLRAASARLLQKHGLEPSAQSIQDLEAAVGMSCIGTASNTSMSIVVDYAGMILMK